MLLRAQALAAVGAYWCSKRQTKAPSVGGLDRTTAAARGNEIRSEMRSAKAEMKTDVGVAKEYSGTSPRDTRPAHSTASSGRMTQGQQLGGSFI